MAAVKLGGNSEVQAVTGVAVGLTLLLWKRGFTSE